MRLPRRRKRGRQRGPQSDTVGTPMSPAGMMRPSDAPLVGALKGRRHPMKRSICSFTAWNGMGRCDGSASRRITTTYLRWFGWASLADGRRFNEGSPADPGRAFPTCKG